MVRKGLAGEVGFVIDGTGVECIGRLGMSGSCRDLSGKAGMATMVRTAGRVVAMQERIGKDGAYGVGLARWQVTLGVVKREMYWKGPNMSTRDEIDTLIAEAGSNALTAETVVERAKDADKFPALYAHLWGVSEADLAQEARIGRAHKLLISIRIVSEEGTSTRLLMHTPGDRGYRPVNQVVQSLDLAQLKLRQLAADIGRARERLRAFRSFIPDAVADEIDASLKTAEDRASPPPQREAVA